MIPKGIEGGFKFAVLQRNLKGFTREAMDLRLRVLKEINKCRLNSYSVRNNVLIISDITLRDCRLKILPDNLSRNSCIY